VSKTVELERIRSPRAASSPRRIVQEAKEGQSIGRAVPWHLIGSLQTKQARCPPLRLIQSVDRVELAHELDRRPPGRARPALLVQVNIVRIPEGGVHPAELKRLLDAITG